MNDDLFDLAYRQFLEETAAEQKLFLAPYSRSKTIYFHQRGIEYPWRQSERVELAHKFLNRNPPDPKAALLLFNPDDDAEYLPWIKLLWSEFNSKDSALFNPNNAVCFAWKASTKDDLEVLELLADYYYLCEENPSNRNAAAELYKKSFELERNVESGWKLVEIYSAQENLAFDQIYNSSRILSILQKLLQSGKEIPRIAKFTAASFYGSGHGLERNHFKAADLYTQMILKDKSDYINNIGLRNLIIRMALGLGIQRDVESARNLYEWTKQSRCGCYFKYDALFEYLQHANEAEYQENAALLSDFCVGGEDFKMLHLLIDSDFFINESFIQTVRLLTFLARGENWDTANEWANFVFYSQARCLNFDFLEVNKNTFKLGPFYNRIAENGLPVLGDFEAALYGSHLKKNGETILPGLIKFNGIKADSLGNLSMDFESSEIQPAFVLQEDINVALVLAFGENNFEWPSISINPYKSGQKEYFGLQEKVYNRTWLAQTDFGRTLYITDFLAGALSWETEEFKIFEKSPDLVHKISQCLVNDIVSLEGPDPEGQDSLNINVNPGLVNLSIESNKNNQDIQTWKIQCHDVNINIDGGYNIKGEDGKIEKWKHRNDPTYIHGKKAQVLTEKFNEIAIILPVYERLRQLMAMVYALQALRDKGFKPNRELQDFIKQRQGEFIERNANKTPEFVRPLPILQKLELGC